MATRYAVVELESVESTQNEARDRYDRLGPVLVMADHQTSGRGRLGREWIEPDRAMFASLAFEPVWPIESWSLIPLTAGLAARSAIGDVSGITTDLRWPNDLMIGGGKIGGLLVESGDGVVVVGCGINLAWAAPVVGGDALYGSDPGPEVVTELAAEWADRFLARMALDPGDWGLEEYREACITIGRSVSYAAGTGIAAAVLDDGSLLVETEDGVISVNSGEVRLHDRSTLSPDRRN
ncbi:MAG: biotin--[acetyl-CoA-carboxylase] ligase [Actinomycetota bacterium]|nr:biotin--[acetyl-CoA-carboxylase] ligase [Actinomycetota bacterium]